MTDSALRRSAALGGATGALTATAARPLTAGAVLIPAQRSRPPRRFEPYGPDHGADGRHRFRGRPPPARAAR